MIGWVPERPAREGRADPGSRRPRRADQRTDGAFFWHAARRIGEKEEAARYYRMTEGLSEDPAVRPLVKQGLEETLGAGKAK